MTNPSGVTMPTFETTEGTLYVLRKSATVLGQVSRVQPQSQTPTRKVARIGDTNKKTTYQPTEHSAQLEMYSELDPDDLALVLGGTTKPATGGWADGTELRLNPSVAAFDLFVDVYSSNTNTGSDALVGTWNISDFKPANLSLNIGADQTVLYTLNGECSDVYYTPTSGYGA